MKKLKAIDLFSGVGGLTLGLEQAGFTVIAAIEKDKVTADSYKLNHKNHRVYVDDIKNINPKKLMSELKLKSGELDLLAGCPPCQGFSSLRTKKKKPSVSDRRNSLIWQFLSYVKVFKPKTIMMENVPGLAEDFRIKKFKSEINKLGYVVNNETISVIDASDYGVPQRRKRMLLKASRLGEIELPKKIKKRKTVFDAIGKLPKPRNSRDNLHQVTNNRSEKTKKLIKLIPKDGGSRSDLPKRYWLPCHLKSPGSYRDVYGRMAWKSVSPTITGGCTNPSKGRFLHPTENRAITLREAALLQTFPRSYKFSFERGRDAVALMIGNALPPEMIRRYADQYKLHINSNC